MSPNISETMLKSPSRWLWSRNVLQKALFQEKNKNKNFEVKMFMHEEKQGTRDPL